MFTFKDFLNEKGITDEAWKAKTAEEMAALHKEYNEAVQKKIADAIEGKASKEDVQGLINKSVEGLKGFATTEEITAIKESLKEQGEALTALKMNGGANQSESFNANLENALTEALPQLKALKSDATKKGQEVVMTIKAPVNVTTGAVANASGVTTPDSIVYNQGLPYAEDVRPMEYIISVIDNGTTNKPSLPYMDKLPTEGTMAITEEGALKPLISVSFKLNYSEAKKIAGRTKISEEALDDIPGLMAIINNELRYEHDMAQQSFIFDEINDIAGAFVAGDMAASTDAPSNYDAIRAATYAVKIGSNGRFIPNVALVPSSDVYNMGATKDANNNYVLPPFVLPDGTRVAGVRVLEVNDDTVAPGSFIVGDFRKLKRRVYKSFTVRIGQGIQGSTTAGEIVSDFESNMYTVLGESRQHLWIYENEKVAFVKSTFAAVKTAIETVAA
jgi:HK97 family phage major capsid protein